MKSVTRKTALFLTLALSLATVGCGEDTPKAAESDQRELLNNASTLTVTGDLDDIVLAPQSVRQLYRQQSDRNRGQCHPDHR